MTRKFPAAILICLLLLPGGAGCRSGKPIYSKSVFNQQAPPLDVEKWITPEPDTKGKFILIDFWATWCPSCVEAIPEMNDFQQKFRDKLVVIGLTDESEADVRAMKKPEIGYSVATDTQGRLKKALEITGIPHVIIIDPHGIVRWEGLPSLQGYELTDAVLRNIIDTYGK